MGKLVWTYGNGVEFQSARAGFRLIVARAQVGPGFRYTVAQGESVEALLASGSRENLRDAIDAAEQALNVIDPDADHVELIS